MINSDEFKVVEGHVNPKLKPYESFSRVADRVRLDEYELSKGLKSRLPAYPFENLKKVVDAAILPEDGTVRAAYVFIGESEASPQVGDIKISWERTVDVDVSVVARQSGRQLTSYQTKVGNSIELIREGNVTAAEIFAQEHRMNKFLAWLLRLVGFVICMFGFLAIFAFFKVLADFVPLFGSIVGFATGFVAVLLAIAVSAMTIAVAWFYFRPMISLLVGVVSVALVVGLIFFKRKKSRRVVAADGELTVFK